MEMVKKRNLDRCIFLLGLLVFPNVVVSDGVKCTKEGCGCVFKDAEGAQKKISMSAINKEGQPFFKDQPYPSIVNPIWLYSLNLCTGFTQGTACEDVTGCQVYKSTNKGFPIGKPGTEAFGDYTTGQPLTVTYDATDGKGAKRFMVVKLICSDQDPPILTIKGQTQSNYNFEVSSKSLCPEAYTPTPATKASGGGLSAGSIIVIVFFVVLVVYFVSGVLFMKYRREATGKEVIPNLNFWSALPGYIKDGCVFSGRKVKQLCSREDNAYEGI